MLKSKPDATSEIAIFAKRANFHFSAEFWVFGLKPAIDPGSCCQHSKFGGPEAKNSQISLLVCFLYLYIYSTSSPHIFPLTLRGARQGISCPGLEVISSVKLAFGRGLAGKPVNRPISTKLAKIRVFYGIMGLCTSQWEIY